MLSYSIAVIIGLLLFLSIAGAVALLHAEGAA